jgi:hypothetical protein
VPQTKHEHALLLQRSEISRLEEALEAAEFNAAEEGVEGVVALETQLAVAAAAVAGLRAEVLTRTATLLAERERERERERTWWKGPGLHITPGASSWCHDTAR